MSKNQVFSFLKDVLKNLPEDWVKLTTHRLDIYNEEKAKVEFIEEFEALYNQNLSDQSSLNQLPTAYDYIRLGHPLSSVLEWTLAKINGLSSEQVISFSSITMPIMAVLRRNLFLNKNTLILHEEPLPQFFDIANIKKVYGYSFETKQINSADQIPDFEGSIIYFSKDESFLSPKLNSKVDFSISINSDLGSILMVNKNENIDYIADIQHVRRRETISMTPADCLSALKLILGESISTKKEDRATNKASVLKSIKEITATDVPALVGSSGLSIQYSIMMGLIDYATEKHPGKAIKIIVPPNCYGGTNDQARRVAACSDQVEIMDLPVDGDNDMVRSTEQVLSKVAKLDAIPLIIAEIPTNPRVEVPDLEDLRKVLVADYHDQEGNVGIKPVFILDQTFCPNVQFLSEEGILSPIQTISYVSGSKFPSGGKCTAGYCVANQNAAPLMGKIEKHLQLCDNEATDLQISILAEQMPSMLDRIAGAYRNTRDFVNFIEKTLPTAKINFVSEELAEQEFTPSVFSLDLPTKGDNEVERENYKRELNHKLISMMINQIPEESKYCVSYGQLKGCYWTIPATSTQGTTKESDKDYIARVSVSPDLDLEKHKQVFKQFVEEI